MIKVTLMDGPLAPSTRTFQGKRNLETGKDVEPYSMSKTFLLQDWSWVVDYSQATPDETVEWFREDFGARTYRALKSGRSVWFLGREFRLQPGQKLVEACRVMEDFISASGEMITIESDDEKGVVIGIR